MYIQLMRSPLISFFFFYSYVDHLDLHSFPTRRSSDLNYARLYPQPAGGSCDVNAVVRETISRVSDTGQAELRLELAEGLRPARTDALVLRRILENLVGNEIGRAHV